MSYLKIGILIYIYINTKLNTKNRSFSQLKRTSLIQQVQPKLGLTWLIDIHLVLSTRV